MSESGSGNLRPASTQRTPSRTPNLSGGWVVMLLSALIAGVLYLYATQQASDRVAVAVMANDITAGQAVTEDSFGRVEVSMNDTQLGKLIKFEDRERFTGFVARGPIQQGDLVLASALREPAAADGQRSMSIPIERSHAVGGDIQPGDRIDVIDPDSENGYIARDVAVLKVESETGGAIGAVDAFSVTVEVNDAQAVAIARTVNEGNIDLVRATGADPAPAPVAGASSIGTTTTTNPDDTP